MILSKEAAKRKFAQIIEKDKKEAFAMTEHSDSEKIYKRRKIEEIEEKQEIGYKIIEELFLI